MIKIGGFSLSGYLKLKTYIRRMNNQNPPRYPPAPGTMTETIRAKYIEAAVASQLLPRNAHRMEPVISLEASPDKNKPIQFWQLYSVMGAERIIAIVSRFYDRVFEDERWFTSVFERVGGKNRHVQTQSAMWIDVMGGGSQYHGGEFRLNFHHTHNAVELMNSKGAERWVSLMIKTLNDPDIDYTDDPRVRPAVNTFLSHFMGKYAEDFSFENTAVFGETNPPLKRRINFLNMTSEAIEQLGTQDLIDELSTRGIDVSQYADKSELVSKALRL